MFKFQTFHNNKRIRNKSLNKKVKEKRRTRIINYGLYLWNLGEIKTTTTTTAMEKINKLNGEKCLPKLQTFHLILLIPPTKSVRKHSLFMEAQIWSKIEI